jgi:hypothetical protein
MGDEMMRSSEDWDAQMTSLEINSAAFGKRDYKGNRACAAGEMFLRAFRKMARTGEQIGWLRGPLRWDFPTWVPRARPYDQEFDDA